MDYDVLLFWSITFFSVTGLILNAVRIRITGPGWLVVYALILLLCITGRQLQLNWLIYAAGLAWLLFGLLPAILSRICFKLLLQQRYSRARRLAVLMRWLHPADGWPAQPGVIHLLETEQRGDLETVKAGLQRHLGKSSPTSLSAVASLFRATNQWAEMRAWDLEHQIELDRMPQLLSARLRARGEVDDFRGMFELYEQFEQQIAKLLPQVRSLCRLMLFAFSGNRDQVEHLFAGTLAAIPPATQRFWLATSDLYGGRSETAKSQFESLRPEADPSLRRAIDRRLSQATPAPPSLDDAATALLARISVEQEHEERFTGAHKLFSRNARATQLIMALNLAMFAVEVFTGGSTDMQNIYRLGAMYAPAVQAGEWWRLVTALFLHLGPLHLAMNLAALWVLGPFVEHALGFRKFLALYLIAGIGSMAAVFALAGDRAASQITIGASGAIMALAGATGALMLKGWLRHKASAARRRLVGMIIIIASQSVFDALVPQVSMKAHLSGAASGFLIALLLPDRLSS